MAASLALMLSGVFQAVERQQFQTVVIVQNRGKSRTWSNVGTAVFNKFADFSCAFFGECFVLGGGISAGQQYQVHAGEFSCLNIFCRHHVKSDSGGVFQQCRPMVDAVAACSGVNVENCFEFLFCFF